MNILNTMFKAERPKGDRSLLCPPLNPYGRLEQSSGPCLQPKRLRSCFWAPAETIGRQLMERRLTGRVNENKHGEHTEI